MKQSELVEKLGGKISKSHVSMILSGSRRPAWDKAKLLAQATGTSAEFWMEATPKKMQKAVEGVDTGKGGDN